MNRKIDIAVIGAGAAGCFCAIEVKRSCPELSVSLFEAGRVPMAKLALTGGGRCNLTNTFAGVRNLSEVYPRGERLMKRALKEFGPEETMRWFEREGVKLVVQEDECVFPQSQDAMQIVHVLEGLIHRLGVELACNKKVISLSPLSCEDGSRGGFRITFSDGEQVEANKIVFTIGGCSSAALEKILPQGIDIVPTVPSLYTFKIADEGLRSLMGTVVPGVSLGLAGTSFRSEGILLITDWGVSGPATLRLSSYAARHLAEREYKAGLVVNWLGLGEVQARACLTGLAAAAPKKFVSSVRPDGIADRLWRHILLRCGFREDLRWAELGSKGMNRLVGRLTADEYQIEGRARFKDEFVTCGGVALSGIDLSTQQSRLYPGLYFAGEVLDVDAVTGGFNLQAAWSMGWRAAKQIQNKFVYLPRCTTL